ELAYGVAESALEFAHLGGDELGEAQQHRRRDATAPQVVDDLFHVGRGFAVAFGRVDDQVALAIDAEVPGPPVLYAVGLKRLFYGRGQLPLCCLPLSSRLVSAIRARPFLPARRPVSVDNFRLEN